jgi:hypothetical protein
MYKNSKGQEYWNALGKTDYEGYSSRDKWKSPIYWLSLVPMEYWMIFQLAWVLK